MYMVITRCTKRAAFLPGLKTVSQQQAAHACGVSYCQSQFISLACVSSETHNLQLVFRRI